MQKRTATRLAWSLWSVGAVAIAAATWLQVLNGWTTGQSPQPGDLVIGVTFYLGQLAFITVGGLIASRRPRNPIGWMFLGGGMFFTISQGAESYGIYSLFTNPGSLPGGLVAAWLATWSIGPSFGFVTILMLLFPDGRPLTSRWRIAIYISLLGLLALSISGALLPGPLEEDSFKPFTNPFGIKRAGPLLKIMNNVGWGAWNLGTLTGAISLILRYKRGDREQRQQLKWFMSAAGLVAIGFIGTAVSWRGGDLQWLFLTSVTLIACGLIAMPFACAIAILKYRLYQIDMIINKAILFGLMAGFIGAVYILIVVGMRVMVFGSGPAATIPSVFATLVVAIAFQPVRERARGFANRLVYGHVSTPYEALAKFSAGAGMYAADEALVRMAQVIGEGTNTVRSTVWLKIESQLVPVASWPVSDGDSSPITINGDVLPAIANVDRALAVVHQEELLGAITVTKARGDSLTPTEDHLLSGLASHAGLVLRNLSLRAALDARLKEVTSQAQELQASRMRIVAARDSERRRLERDIHDGAQQNLVALAVKIGLAKSFATRDASKARALLAEVKDETTRALDTLRNLSHGIYPPVLTRQGLVAALESEAIGSAVPTSIDAGDLPRFGGEIEAAAYFCCLESLQNIAKYAQASRIEIKLRHNDANLVFFVIDDGVGFDPAATRTGTGLQNMRDRVVTLGGDVFITSAPGQGTTVRGRIPARAMVSST